jgi:NTE family protein
MKNKLAFVLGGGGSRGALQVGALYALLEADVKPDLLVGTSIGSVNSAFIALHGFTRETLDELTSIWHEVSALDLLPGNYLWLTMRAMFRHTPNDPSQRLKDFIISKGLGPDLSFSQFQQPRLVIVTADINTGKPVLYSDETGQNVLDALLLSTALPPWFMPVKGEEYYEMDGGLVSNLPVEAALKYGATQIVAFDLIDTRQVPGVDNRFTGFLAKVSMAVEKRHTDLELELAKAHGVPLLYLPLLSSDPIPMWDFRHTEELIKQGYEITRQAIAEYKELNPSATSLLQILRGRRRGMIP